MSTPREVPFELLRCDGSNYPSWSAHVLNILRTMGPSFERVVKASVLPKDVDDLSKLSTEEKECLSCNHRVTNLLFEYMDKELSDSIQEEKLLRKTRSEAHHLWKFLEKIYEDESENEDEEEESLEVYSTATINTHPLVTSHDDQGARSKKSAGSLLEPVRPVCKTGQTGPIRGQRKESKKCSRRRSRQVSVGSASSSDVDHQCLMANGNKEHVQEVEPIKAIRKELECLKLNYDFLVSKSEVSSATSSHRIDSLQKENQMLKAKLEKLSSDHVTLQGTHMELEKSYEKLVESHVMIEMAHEVVVNTVKSYEPLIHTCTCSQVQIDLTCTKPCCSQASQSSIEQVFVESCDDFIAKENEDLMCEVKRLKEEVTKLKGKGQVRPSQDNRDPVVKKLEMGSNFTSSAHQLGQKSIKHKIPRKKNLEHIKCFKCLEKGHYARNCQIKSDEEAQLSRNQKGLLENRMCHGCKKLGHMVHCCPQKCRSDQTGQTGRTIPVRPVQASAAAGPIKKPTRSILAHRRTTDAQKSKIQVNSTFVKLKHRICYTCRAKGHMSKDCLNGKVLNSKLVQYNFARLGRDKISTYATKIIQSPNASIRAIWVPKSIVTNIVGSNKGWTPKNA